MSLTGCLKKAGELLSTEDRAAVVSSARKFRAEGVATDEAGIRALKEQLASVSSELRELQSAPAPVVEPVQAVAAAEKAPPVEPPPAPPERGAPGSRGASDAKQLTAEFTKFLRVDALGRMVTVVQSVGDLPFAPGVAQSVGINAQTQGFVMGGKSYFIADNIAPGKGKAVFMHEVGSHLGVQQLLTQGEFKNLVNTVMGWAGGKAGPEAQKIARAAMARVRSAQTKAAQYNTELVAYAVEEATLAGYNPSAAGNEGPIKAWMRSVVQQVKNILTKLGMNPDKFNVQDLVDLAYGAARAVQSMDVQTASDSPQFSKAAETPQAKAINVSHSALQSAFKDAWATTGDLGSSFLKKAAFTSDLVNMAANNGLGTAHAYLKAMNAVQTEKVKLVQEVQDVVEDFGKLTPDEQGQGPLSVNLYLRDSTMAKSWGHVPEWKPTAKVDAAMGARYDALSPRAQALVDRVFKHGENVRTHLKNAADATVKREFGDAIKAAEAAKRPEQVVKLKADQELALKDSGKGLAGDWPYAPLGRFGDHVVLAMSARYLQAVKDGNKKLIGELQTDAQHYQVERTDTMRSARVLAESLQTNFPGGHVTSFEKGPENSLVYGGRDALGALTRLRHLVKDSASDDLKLDAQANNAIDKSLRDLHLQLLSETSARKSGLGRANIAGANKDMMRTFAGQGQAMAHYIATLRMGADVQDQLQAMKDQAEERTPGDTQRRAYYNELLKRHVLNLDYKPNKAVEAGMAMSSIWTLLTNPAHHLTNGLQTVMSTLPQMAGKHGYRKSSAALTTAYHDLGPIIKGRSFKEMDFTKLPEDVRAMAKALADRGSIGVDQGLELGQFESAPDGKTHVFTTVVDKLRGMAEGVEAVNRLSAAMAAYRLEISNGATPQAAIEYAHKTVLETHGDYSGFNAPRIMRNGVGRLLTQFKKYQLIQLSLYAKLGHQAFNGASPEERAVAYKTLAFNLAHLAAIGGMTGLPGFALAAWIMGKVFGDKDEPENAEAKLRKMIGDKHLADLLLHGAPKFAGVDLSTRLGGGDLLTPLPYSEPGLNRKGYESVLLGLSGPLLGGLLPRFADGLGQMSKSIDSGRGEDFFKGLEQLVPNGLANTMKAVRYQANGLTQRNGDTVIQPEDLSVLTSISQALGLPSNAITDKNFLAGQMRASGEFYKQRSQSIKQAYVNAQENNNADGMKESRTDWMRMQGVLREQGYTTQPLSVLLKAPSEKRKREASAVSGVETTKRTKGAVELLTE